MCANRSFKNTEHDSVVQALSVLSNVTIRTDMTGFVASTSFAADRVKLDATSGVWTIFPANQVCLVCSLCVCVCVDGGGGHLVLLSAHKLDVWLVC